MPGQPGPRTTSVSPAGAAPGVKQDQSLTKCLVDVVGPCLAVQQDFVTVPSPGSVAAGFHPVAIAYDHADVEAYQGPHIGCSCPPGADDADRLVRAGERGRDLLDPRVQAARVLVDLREKFHFLLERNRADRVFVPVATLVGEGRREFQGSRRTACDGPHGVRGAPE